MKSLFGITSTAILAACVAINASQAQTSPTLAWNKIALETVERAKPTQHQAMRLLTYLSLAQHAALTETDPAGDTLATASMRVIAELIPAQASFVEQRYREMAMRDSEKGQRIARALLDQARNDGFTQPWTGQPPRQENVWRSLNNPPAPPAYPAIGGMRMFFVDSASVLRSAPPPAFGGARFQADLAEVKRFATAPTEETTRSAKFYDMTTGTLVAGFWNETAVEMIRGAKMNDLLATTALATVNAAMLDAVVACHDVKYTYWVPRPSQADPSIKTLIGVPNHPSYPSNHAGVSTAAALVLAHFFPPERERLEGLAAAAGMSRIHAGIHYRFDMEAGEEIGRKVAAAAVTRHPDMLVRRTQKLASN